MVGFLALVIASCMLLIAFFASEGMRSIFYEAVFFWPLMVAALTGASIAGQMTHPLFRNPINLTMLGPRKTWSAYPVAAIFSTGMLSLECWFYGYPIEVLWPLGTAIGFGVVSGDYVRAFIKQGRGIPYQKVWLPFDRIDYVIGGWLGIVLTETQWFSARFNIRDAMVLLTLLLLALFLRPVGYYMFYRVGLRRTAS